MKQYAVPDKNQSFYAHASRPRGRGRWLVAAVALAWGMAQAAVIPATQQQYQLVRPGDQGPFKLQLATAPVTRPGAHQVLIKVHAASLNRRDIFVQQGFYPVGTRRLIVPLSDGAGEVVEAGPGVTRVHAGDRVAGIFFQDWLQGRPGPHAVESALGGFVDGMLSQYVILDEQGVVKIPPSLSYEEAATLPCAGVTAWNGLFTRGHIQAGDYVLLEGTGGVSLFGLPLALAAGAKPIITSSHDEKLARAEALGAIGGVNYKTHPDWDKQVLELTGGRGVQQVLEVGGKDSLPHALAALSSGGHVALIGGLGGFGGDVPVMTLMNSNATASGIYVGSRADFEALNAYIEKHHIRPVIDRVFEFKDAQAAFDTLQNGESFGKVVIRVAP